MKSRLLNHFSISNLIRLMIACALIGPSLLTTSFSHRAAQAAIRDADNSIDKEAAARALVDANYGKLQLSFEINRGQADKQIKFLARAAGSSLLLKNDEAVLTLSRAEKIKDSSKTKQRLAFNEEPTRRITSTIRMKLVNANPNPHIVGLEEQQAKSSYSSAAIRSSGRPMCRTTRK